MSTIVDQTLLALLSLKETLEDYLDDNKWKNKYNLIIAGDPRHLGKEVVLTVRDSNNEIALPIISIETGSERNETQELGDEFGIDFITVSLIVVGADHNQARTLGSILKRKLNGLVFNVLDYTSPSKTVIGTSELSNIVLDDISDWNSTNVADKFVILINTTMELSGKSLI